MSSGHISEKLERRRKNKGVDEVMIGEEGTSCKEKNILIRDQITRLSELDEQ